MNSRNLLHFTIVFILMNMIRGTLYYDTQAMLKLKDFLYYEDTNTDVGFYRKIVDFVDLTMFKRKVQLKFIMQYTSCPRSQKMSQNDVLYSCPLNEDSEFFRCTAVVSSRYEHDVLMQCKRSSTYCKTNSIYDCSPPMFEEADSMMLRAANQIFFDDLRIGKGKFKRVLAILGETYEKRSVTMKIKYQETNCTVGSDNMLIVDDVYSDRCPVENLSGTCEVYISFHDPAECYSQCTSPAPSINTR